MSCGEKYVNRFQKMENYVCERKKKRERYYVLENNEFRLRRLSVKLGRK